MLLGEAGEGMLGEPEPVAPVGDQGSEGDGRRSGGVSALPRAERETRLDKRVKGGLDLPSRQVDRLGQRRGARAGARQQGSVDGSTPGSTPSASSIGISLQVGGRSEESIRHGDTS